MPLRLQIRKDILVLLNAWRDSAPERRMYTVEDHCPFKRQTAIFGFVGLREKREGLVCLDYAISFPMARFNPEDQHWLYAAVAGITTATTVNPNHPEGYVESKREGMPWDRDPTNPKGRLGNICR